MKRTFVSLIAVLICGFSASAQDTNGDKTDKICDHVVVALLGNTEPMAAIDPILTGDKKPVNCSFRTDPSIGEERKAFSLFLATPKLNKDEWITSSFSFRVRSRQKGRVLLRIWPYKDPKNADDVVFMGIAQISSPQISFPNGGYFVNENLKNWGYKEKITDKNMMPAIKTDSKLKTPGRKYMRLCQPLLYKIDVKPDQVITISFTVKAMEYLSASR